MKINEALFFILNWIPWSWHFLLGLPLTKYYSVYLMYLFQSSITLCYVDFVLYSYYTDYTDVSCCIWWYPNVFFFLIIQNEREKRHCEALTNFEVNVLILKYTLVILLLFFSTFVCLPSIKVASDCKNVHFIWYTRTLNWINIANTNHPIHRLTVRLYTQFRYIYNNV